MERHEHLTALEIQLYNAVPAIDPPALHWLSSDASFSYCYPCAQKARLAEEGLDAWPDKGETFTWERTPEQQAAADLIVKLEEGIDGGFSSPSDGPESCETCGCTLEHTLTEEGVQDELAHFAENPGFERFGPEDSYAISRICLNLSWEGAPADQVEEAIKIVEDALEAIAEGRTR